MMWLLDTCVISELTRKEPNAAVAQWLTLNADNASLSTVTLGEIQYGIERLAVGRGRNTLQLWFDGLCSQFVARMVPADDAVWRAYGRLKASVESIGRPQEDLDLLIAACAAVNQLTLVTRNVKHFEDTGIKILNPWIAH
ncbi:MAG: hypothetical protein RLZZ573_2228 [Pseudomonadota bacterium]